MSQHLVLCSLSALATVWAQAAFAAPVAWNDDALVAAFLAHSPRVQAERALIQQAQAELLAAGLTPNPALEMGREQVFSPGGPAEQNRLGLQVPVTLGGKLSLRRAVAEAQVAAARARAEHQIFMLTQDVRETFLQAYCENRRVQLFGEQAVFLSRLQRMIHARKKSGEGSGYDVLRVELALESAEAQRSQARAAEHVYRARLAGLLGQALEGAWHMTPLPPVPNGAALLAQALEARQDLAALRAEAAGQQHLKKLAGTMGWPDPSLALGALNTNEPTVQGWGYTAGLSWPVPFVNRGQAETARAEAAAAEIHARTAAIVTQIQSDVPAARASLSDQLGALTRLNAAAAQQTGPLLKMAQLAYQEGEHGIDALLSAHQAALDTRLRQLEMVRACRSAWLSLERMVGARLHAPRRSPR